jgi:lambda family phage portal protein
MHTLADWERMWQAEGAPQPHRRSGRRGGYQGADLGRLMSSLARSPVPPDSFLRAELAVLVARAREQARNDDHVRAYLRIRKRNVIGPAGITTYARVTDGNGRPDTLAQKAIDEAWWDWGRKGWCDYHARRNWRALQSMADKTKATDGDSFVRLHRGFAGNKYRFAVELVDAMHCPLTLWQDLGKRGQIRMGVEFDAAGRRVAYWIRTTERRNPDCYEIDGGLFERVPARDMLHLYDEDFVSQTRGRAGRRAQQLRADGLHQRRR